MERSKGLFEPRTSAQSEFFSASYPSTFSWIRERFKGYRSDFGSALGIMGKAKRCFSRSPFPASFAWTLCVLMVHCVILIDRSQKSRFSFSKHLRRQGTRQSFSRFQYALTQPNLNCSKIWSKELPRNARSLLRVDVRCSKASLLDHGPVTNFAWTFYG